MSCLVHVFVTTKKSVLDPQGDATLNTLKTLGFEQIENVRIGKLIQLTFQENLATHQLKEQATLMAQKLLCNEVMENFHIQIIDEERGTL